jgi:ABC-2 type transport system ATP-binding protein
MTATTTAAVEATGLRKSFGDTTALDGIDLRVATGTVFALLGPNGAGKTTAVHILATLIDADAGEVRVDGHDPSREPAEVRRVIGVTGQFSAVDSLLTAEENLALMADLHHLERTEGRRRISQLLDRFELADAADRPSATFSGGMRRRLDLAMTLVGDPKIIFLDEPTTGLDPRSRRAVWEIVRDLVEHGVTILLTTHYLEEADELADRVAVLDHGTVIAEGTPEQLKRLIPGGSIGLEFADGSALAAVARVFPEATIDHDGSTLHVPSDGRAESFREVLDRLDGAHATVERISVHSPDLDEVFLSLTRSNRGGERR